MTLNKSIWTILTLSSINASTESTLSDCNTVDLSSTIHFALTLENKYATNASQPSRLTMYTSPDNASDWDTEAYGYFDNAVAINTSKQITLPISPDPKYVKVTVTNQDSKNISSITVIATQGVW